MSHSRQSSVTHSVKRYTLEHGEVQVAKQTGHIAIGTVRTSWSVGWRRTRAHMDGLVCHLCYMSELWGLLLGEGGLEQAAQGSFRVAGVGKAELDKGSKGRMFKATALGCWVGVRTIWVDCVRVRRMDEQ
eukprot:6107844-Pyramimonas_sp.AAC.1